jgi:hypothetical protein
MRPSCGMAVVLAKPRRRYYRRCFLSARDEREDHRIAANIAKLPGVPRQILKDIPRPPNSAD